VTAHFECTDAISGIATCPPDETVSTEARGAAGPHRLSQRKSLMARYEYRCDRCRVTTEVTASIGARDLVVVACPVCGACMARQLAAPTFKVTV
jgi:putative FmdB family regulatory protein